MYRAIRPPGAARRRSSRPPALAGRIADAQPGLRARRPPAGCVPHWADPSRRREAVVVAIRREAVRPRYMHRMRQFGWRRDLTAAHEGPEGLPSATSQRTVIGLRAPNYAGCAARIQPRPQHHPSWGAGDPLATPRRKRVPIEAGPAHAAARMTAAGHWRRRRRRISARRSMTNASRWQLQAPSIRGTTSPRLSRYASAARSQ